MHTISEVLEATYALVGLLTSPGAPRGPKVRALLPFSLPVPGYACPSFFLCLIIGCDSC